jgi:hypothetical protein
LSYTPNCKIEVYDTSNTLIHTINLPVSAHIHDILTSDVGTFNFTVNQKIGEQITYSDIKENWKTKIYLGYGVLGSSNLLCTGKIQKISGPLKTGEGYLRIFSGQNLGEILFRMHKKNKRWQDVDADDVVADVISDLSLGTAIDTVTDNVTITVNTESYFDILKKVSDYWISAGTQLKMDFYVNPAGELIWKTRPLRTSGVESLAIGANLQSYEVTRDVLAVKNNITVYGNASAPYPNDKDLFTETLDFWSASVGTMSRNSSSPKAGTYWITCETGAMGKEVACTLTFPDILTIRTINQMIFWGGASATVDGAHEMRLLCPDMSNYYSYNMSAISGATYHKIVLGDSNVYDADENPSGEWTAHGSPNWWLMQGIYFHYSDSTLINWEFGIDKLYFYPERWVFNVQDSDSITDYGQRDAEFTDENLLSNADCQRRANTLLYQLKDPVARVDGVLGRGTSNLKIGDRIPLTIPAEDISAQNFDVVSVNYDWHIGGGFGTSFSAVDSGNTRKLPPKNVADSLINQMKNMREVTTDLYSKIVR